MRLRYPRQQNQAMDIEDPNHNLVAGTWRLNNPLVPVRGLHVPGNRRTEAAKIQRQYICAYYMFPVGSVPWQMNKI